MSNLKFKSVRPPTTVVVSTQSAYGADDRQIDNSTIVAISSASSFVTLNTNGGSFSDGSTIREIAYSTLTLNNDPMKCSRAVPSKEGYQFLGWSKVSPAASGFTDSNWRTNFIRTGVNITSATTLYAVWGPTSILGITGEWNYVDGTTWDIVFTGEIKDSANGTNSNAILRLSMNFNKDILTNPNTINAHYKATYTMCDRPPYWNNKTVGNSYIENSNREEFMYQDPEPLASVSSTWSSPNITTAEGTQFKVVAAFSEVEFKLSRDAGNWLWTTREATHSRTVFKIQNIDPVGTDESAATSTDVPGSAQTIYLGGTSGSADDGYIYYMWSDDKIWYRNKISSSSSSVNLFYSVYDTYYYKKHPGAVLTVIIRGSYDSIGTHMIVDEIEPADSQPNNQGGANLLHDNIYKFLVDCGSDKQLKLFAINDYHGSPHTKSYTVDGATTYQNTRQCLFVGSWITRFIMGNCNNIPFGCFAASTVKSNNAIISFPNAETMYNYSIFDLRRLVDNTNNYEKAILHFYMPNVGQRIARTNSSNVDNFATLFFTGFHTQSTTSGVTTTHLAVRSKNRIAIYACLMYADTIYWLESSNIYNCAPAGLMYPYNEGSRLFGYNGWENGESGPLYRNARGSYIELVEKDPRSNTNPVTINAVVDPGANDTNEFREVSININTYPETAITRGNLNQPAYQTPYARSPISWNIKKSSADPSGFTRITESEYTAYGNYLVPEEYCRTYKMVNSITNQPSWKGSTTSDYNASSAATYNLSTGYIELSYQRMTDTRTIFVLYDLRNQAEIVLYYDSSTMA